MEDYESKPYRIETNTSDLKIEGGRKLQTRASVGVVLRLLGDSIYHSDESAYREQVTNALSHGCQRVVEELGQEAHVEITIDFLERKITITDVNGMGIPFADMDNICVELGTSGNHDRGRSGQHGLGLFSFLRLTDTTILETWARPREGLPDGEHYAFICEGGASWDEIKNNELETYGTKITITVNEKVDLEKIAKSTKDICEYQKIQTLLKVKHAEKIESDVQSYGVENDDWWHGDGDYTFGNVSFEERCLQEAQVSRIKKLEGKDMDIYVGVSEQGGGYGRGGYSSSRTKMFLCNVPVNNTLNNYGFPSIWINLTSEKTYKPPADRDSLHSETMEIIENEVDVAITNWLESIIINDKEEYRVHEDTDVLSNSYIHEKLNVNTKKIVDEMSRKFKCWGSFKVTPESEQRIIQKDTLITYGDLISKYKNVFIQNAWNTRYWAGFMTHFEGEGFVFVKPQVIKVGRGASRAGHDLDIELLESEFKWATDARKELKIKFSTNTASKERASTVQELTVHRIKDWNHTQTVKLSEINKENTLKLQNWNRWRHEQYEKSFVGSCFVYSEYDLLANKKYDKDTNKLAQNFEGLYNLVKEYEFTTNRGLLTGEDILKEYCNKNDPSTNHETYKVCVIEDESLLNEANDNELVVVLDHTVGEYTSGYWTNKDVHLNRLMMVMSMMLSEEPYFYEKSKELQGVGSDESRKLLSVMELTSYVSTLTQRRVMKEFADVAGIPQEAIPMSVVEIIKEQSSKVPEKYRKFFIQIATNCYKRVNTDNYEIGERGTDDEHWYVECPPPWLAVDYQAINGYYIIPEVWKVNESDTRYHSPTPINLKTHDAWREELVLFLDTWFEQRELNPEAKYRYPFGKEKNPSWDKESYYRDYPIYRYFNCTNRNYTDPNNTIEDSRLTEEVSCTPKNERESFWNDGKVKDVRRTPVFEAHYEFKTKKVNNDHHELEAYDTIAKYRDLDGGDMNIAFFERQSTYYRDKDSVPDFTENIIQVYSETDFSLLIDVIAKITRCSDYNHWSFYYSYKTPVNVITSQGGLDAIINMNLGETAFDLSFKGILGDDLIRIDKGFGHFSLVLRNGMELDKLKSLFNDRHLYNEDAGESWKFTPHIKVNDKNEIIVYRDCEEQEEPAPLE